MNNDTATNDKGSGSSSSSNSNASLEPTATTDSHNTFNGTTTTSTRPSSSHPQQQQQQQLQHPEQVDYPLPRYYPRWRNGDPWYFGNPEALGWVLDATGRAVSFISAGAFLGTALLRLAKQEVGCEVDPPPGSTVVPECNERVYGLFKPSSLLTTYTIVVGLASAVFLPVMGAVVDYTPHRQRIGRWFSFFVCILLFPQIFIAESTWPWIAALQILVAFVGWAQSLITHAYLPELSNDPERINVLTQSFTIASYGSMVFFLLAVIGVTTAFGLNDIAAAQLAMAAAFIICSLTLYPAWAHLLQKRPAMRQLPPGRSLWTAGFVQVWQSGRYIWKNWKALKWFYVNVTLVGAAVSSLGTIMITYLTDTLLFSSTENGVAILMLLLGSIPGALLAGKSVHIWNPFTSSLIAVLSMTANTILAAIVLREPGQQLETYLLALIWGTGAGWKWTTDRLVISTILPATGQDAELMGFYLFCGQVLSWLPPLIYTLVNEAGVNQRIGIGSISIFFVGGSIAIVLMGNYDDAVALAGRVVVPHRAAAAADEEENNNACVCEAKDNGGVVMQSTVEESLGSHHDAVAVVPPREASDEEQNACDGEAKESGGMAMPSTPEESAPDFPLDKSYSA